MPERSARACSCLYSCQVGDRSPLGSETAARVKDSNGRQDGKFWEWQVDGARDKFKFRHPELGSWPSTGRESPLSGNTALETLSLEVLPGRQFLERLWADEFID